MVATLEAALHDSGTSLELVRIASVQFIASALSEHKPHLLFCPQVQTESAAGIVEALQRYSPDTVLVWISPATWQGLTAWVAGVESCTLPLNDVDCFGQYVEFLLHYALLKHGFRQSKHLLGIAELRCHWLVDYSWEAIAYISQGVHLYANNAYITLFGFESIAELRAIPVAQLVDVQERKLFEALGKVADVGNKPSNRLLTTLRVLDGRLMRAEIRFIPAVLKGRRCYQLHVRPLDQPARTTPLLRPQESPWDREDQMVEATPAPSALASSPRKQVQTEKLAVSGLAEMQPIFSPSIKLRAKAPDVYFAEPSFQPQVGEKVAYAALLGQLRSGSARFRLDYWNLGQAILRLSAPPSVGEGSGYLIFVSVGKGIFDNEAWYRRLLGLLTAAPELARRLVVAFNYQDCMANIRHFGRVAKLLHGAGVQLGVDQLLDDARLLAFIRAVKPAFVRLAPVGNARRLHRLVHQLNETGCKVIVTDVNDATVLSFVCATSAAYLQGRVVRRNN
jgi:hypothetical protein